MLGQPVEKVESVLGLISRIYVPGQELSGVAPVPNLATEYKSVEIMAVLRRCFGSNGEKEWTRRFGDENC